MAIINNLNPILAEIGPLQIRWYGLFFATAILLAYLLLTRIFKREKLKIADLDSLVIYLFVGLVVGARLGHIIFYNFAYYYSHPLEILMIWRGGLASHGAAIGVFLAYLLWIRLKKVKFTKYPDLIAPVIPIPAIFVRIGNFFNSEIIGKPTNSDYGVIFQRLGEDFPRHPVQLYESAGALLVFLILLFAYYKTSAKKYPLLLFFLLLLSLFTMRFIAEFWKMRHVIPESFPLSMGQILSIVPIIAGLVYFIIFFSKRRLFKWNKFSRHSS